MVSETRGQYKHPFNGYKSLKYLNNLCSSKKKTETSRHSVVASSFVLHKDGARSSNGWFKLNLL